MPPRSSIDPNVSRGQPDKGSKPIVVIINPNIPEIKPFKIDFPETVIMMPRPKKAKAKNSGGPNFKAILAICGEQKVIIKALINPPKKDAMVAMPIAFPANPFLPITYPSNTVAAAEGVPGIPIKIAEIDPP